MKSTTHSGFRTFNVVKSSSTALTLEFSLNLIQRAGHEPDSVFAYRAQVAERDFVNAIHTPAGLIFCNRHLRVGKSVAHLEFDISGYRRIVARYAIAARAYVRKKVDPRVLLKKAESNSSLVRPINAWPWSRGSISSDRKWTEPVQIELVTITVKDGTPVPFLSIGQPS